MNIFKILSNGKGTIKEPSVSAYLAYLLDPKENHGLGYEFLKRILQLSNNNDNNVEGYDYQIFLEQAFSQFGEKNQIVDIVILCFENDIKNKKQQAASISIENKNNLKSIYLIENKINSKSKTENQLLKQYQALESVKRKYKVEVFSFYITPDDDKYSDEFREQPFDDKFHLFWNGKDDVTIVSLLKELLNDETSGLIEPISEYSKHTIKAFIQFIDSKFTSERENTQKRKTDGAYTERHRGLNIAYDLERKLIELRKYLLERNNSIKIEEVSLSKKPRDPGLRVLIKNIVISLWAGYEKRDKVSFVFTTNSEFSDSKKAIEKLSKNLGLTIKKDNYPDSYIRTPDMQKPILLENKKEICEMLENLLTIVEKNLP